MITFRTTKLVIYPITFNNFAQTNKLKMTETMNNNLFVPNLCQNSH